MITVAGLGPGDYARIPNHVQDIITDRSKLVVSRTRHHPAADHLAGLRPVVFCDDLYDLASSFETVYEGITQRVLEAAEGGDVVYLVPGSPLMGELSVGLLIDSGHEVEIIPGESFVDATLARVGCDPLDRGLQILNAHDLPDPLVLDKPTIFAQLDRPQVLADVVARIDAVVVEGTDVTILCDLGAEGEQVVTTGPASIDPALAGLRTSLFVDPAPGGLLGAIHTMRLLREECPWDREQTHHSLVKNLVEEVYELIEAIESLPEEGEIDLGSYAAVEDELGDVLLQVLFHEAIGRQRGVLDVDSVAEGLRQKLVRRHPHVFADLVADTPDEVKATWDRIKREEGGRVEGSALSGVPAGMPALHRAAKIQNRAAKVGFDWDEAAAVIPKIREEVVELESALGVPVRVGEELGDLLFSVVNLARHVGVDPELALRGATARFERRFQVMEEEGPLAGLSLAEMDERWERAKTDPPS